MANDLTIGDRMKQYYELPWMAVLPMRMPTILRIDGKAFHALTRGMEKPFDEEFISNMADLALYLCEEIATAQFAYVQSDEISILLHPYKKLYTQPWFGNEVQKLVSVSAGIASAWFTRKIDRIASFDSRVFILPESEVVNYFLWRQMDWEKNSVQMMARSFYSHKELHGKHRKEMIEMIFTKGGSWEGLPTHLRRGICIVKGEGEFVEDLNPPMFSKDRDYIHKYLSVEEE